MTTNDKATRLSVLRTEIKARIEEADELLRTESCYPAASGYWLAHIKTALGGYGWTHSVTMAETIQDLHGPTWHDLLMDPEAEYDGDGSFQRTLHARLLVHWNAGARGPFKAHFFKMSGCTDPLGFCIHPGRRDETHKGIWLDGEFTDEEPEHGGLDADLLDKLSNVAMGNGCPDHWEPDCEVCDGDS